MGSELLSGNDINHEQNDERFGLNESDRLGQWSVNCGS